MRPSSLLTFSLAVVLAIPAGCVPNRSDDDDDDSAGDDDDDSTPVPFRFWSPDFDDGGVFPEEFSCFGGNPELRWEGEPDGTVSMALIFDDPTAGNFPHWAIFNIPAGLGVLEGGISDSTGSPNTPPDGSTELVNGFGSVGYLGSCPATGSTNTYRWRLWALNDTLDAAGISSYPQLDAAATAASIEMLQLSHQFTGR